MDLAQFPRVKLCQAPTPLELLPNLTKALGGPQIWMKRDDLTGMGLGGNKVRKLEFLAGEAVAQGADHLVTQGAVQSNHVRQTAAVAMKLGMRCTAVLEHRIETNDPAYLGSGNVLLDQIMGIEIQYRPGGSDMQAAIEDVGGTLEREGGRPYLIPGGGSNAVGATGYVAVAAELVQQANDLGLKIDRLVHATGSAGTQAGLVAGLHAISSPMTGPGWTAARSRPCTPSGVTRSTPSCSPPSWPASWSQRPWPKASTPSSRPRWRACAGLARW